MPQLILAANDETDLRLMEGRYGRELFQLFDSNREHLRRWHPWIDTMRSVGEVEKAIANWQQQYAGGQECHHGIWFQGQLCGMINYIGVNRSNQWVALSYWLDAR